VAWSEKKTGGSGNFIKWDEPKKIEGTLTNFIHGTYEGKATIQAAIKGDDGVVRTIKVSQGLVNAGFHLLEPGTKVLVEFEGKGKTANGKPFNKLSYRTAVSEKSEPSGPTAAEIEAAKRALQDGVAAGQDVSEYDRLIALLEQSNPKGAAAIKGALAQLYPDPDARLGKLQDTLKQQGVAF
jgi:hypothetical protein